ncbi:MAG: menaquinone biosynthesis protein [Bacteroidales bacterium]|nr:menaquinone biosynthesis protein [Bacteroidales bacterium]
MQKVRISAVKYSNTYPLIYGLLESGENLNAAIEIDHPADCARKILSNEADIGLIPVATIHSSPSLNIVSDYCIGTNGPVRTVLLLSNSPLYEVRTIYLDYRSKTSVALTKVLAARFWKCNCKWADTYPGFDFKNIADDEALVLIGDQCYEMENDFNYRTDLAVEWNKFTAYPFVFAAWVSNKDPGDLFISRFNKALAHGVNNIDRVVDYYSGTGSMPADVLKDYLNNNIDYYLDDKKKMAMNMFFSYLEDL